MILITLVFILAIVAFILAVVFENNFCDETPAIISGIVGVIATVVFLFVAVGAIITNCSLSVEQTKIDIEEEIAYLNNSYEALETASGEVLEFNITQYNAAVKKFKSDIATEKLGRANKWVGCCYSKAYDNYTGDEVKYYRKTE